ncbi:hypothetical protein HED60_07090 [Planctomycetales bacterium ZRK34]|nr:hypothetical protein HED60_07090 [Planctomycetales bacterium ZRK34]
MARDSSAHQKKIIQRYYEHQDTIVLTRLNEMISDLYLCESEKKAATLWKRVGEALAKTEANPVRVKVVMQKKDVTALAQLVSELTVPGNKKK